MHVDVYIVELHRGIIEVRILVDIVELHIDSKFDHGNGKPYRSGKIQHLDTALLWMLYFVKAGKLRMRKVPRAKNTADLGTEELTRSEMWKHPTALHLN